LLEQTKQECPIDALGREAFAVDEFMKIFSSWA